MSKALPFVVAGLTAVLGLAVLTGPGIGQGQERAGMPFGGLSAGASTAAGPQSVSPDINRDIEVTVAQGPWMVCVASYSGPEAPQMARELVTVLRGSRYKQRAYVFNYGAEERRKELERAQAQLQQQKQWLQQMQSEFGGQVGCTPMVRVRRIQEQVAVLIGGYPDMDAAHEALKTIRSLPVDGLKGVKLDQRMFITPDGRQEEDRPVSPFRAAFVVRNPAAPAARPADAGKLDLAVLRRLNAGESYSLLNCRKPVTLAVAQYLLPSPLEKRGKNSSILDKIGLGSKGDEGADPAAVPAHNLAELLRKANLESYVLHTKYASIVTVGAYDSLQDPRLKLMQNRWEEKKFARDERYKMLNLFPKALPMEVPH